MSRMIRLGGLEKLARSMGQLKTERQVFRFRNGKGYFAVIFVIDTNPWKLVITPRGAMRPFSIVKDVHPGYRIEARIGEHYGDLCEYLELTYDPANPFGAIKFWRSLDAQIPAQASLSKRPHPEQVAPAFRGVEEKERPYFYCYRGQPEGSGPTTENLNKTKLLLGRDVYEICKNHRCSSVWTDDPSKAKQDWLQGAHEIARRHRPTGG